MEEDCRGIIHEIPSGARIVRMFRMLVFGMIFWVGAVAVLGESKEELVPTLYTVPPSFFAEPSQQNTRWPSFKPGKGVKLILDRNSHLFSQVYDVKEWFVAMGVSFRKEVKLFICRTAARLLSGTPEKTWI